MIVVVWEYIGVGGPQNEDISCWFHKHLSGSLQHLTKHRGEKSMDGIIAMF